MMKSAILLLYCSLFLFVGCSNITPVDSTQKNATQVLTGLKLNSGEVTLVLKSKPLIDFILRYYDYYNNDQLIVPHYKDNDGATKTIKIELERPAVFTYIDKNKSIPFLLQPGDSLVIESSGTVPHLKLLNNSNSEEVNFFFRLSEDSKSIFDFEKHFLGKYTTTAEKEIKDALLLQYYHNSLQQLRRHKMDASYFDIYEAAIKCEYFRLRINRYYGNTLVRKINDDSFNGVVKDFDLFFSRDTLINHFFFREALIKYQNFKLGILPNSQPDFTYFYDHSVAGSPNKMRDYFAFYAVTALKNKNGPKLDEYLKKFAIDCRDSILAAYVQQHYTRRSELSTSKDYVWTYSGNQKVDLPAIIERYKGTPLYIDFWASWCIPCREEMPASQLLASRYEGKVKFVYISIDRNSRQWQTASRLEKLDSKVDNYLLVDPNNSPIVKRFRINAIPRYLLINKAGEVVNTDAFPPSNKQTVADLDKLSK